MVADLIRVFATSFLLRSEWIDIKVDVERGGGSHRHVYVTMGL